jgi:hypothetical protein
MISRMSSMPVCEAVHFEHVDVARIDDRLAVNAEFLHMDRRLIDRGTAVSRRKLIVESARENARGRRLADAANAGEQIGLMNSIEVEGVFERADHRLLANEVGESGRSVFARQHAIGAWRGAPAGIVKKELIAH